MNLVPFTKLSKNNNSVEISLARWDTFDRTADENGMLTKDFKDTVPSFTFGKTKKLMNVFGLERVDKYLEISKNFAKLTKYKVFSTKSQNRAASAKPTLR